MKKNLILIFIIIVLSIPLIYLGTTKKGKILIVRTLMTESIVKTYSLPKKTDWKPEGLRKISLNKNINSRPVTFGRTMHTDLHSSDEIATVIAPAFKVDWTAEKNFFVPEGPVFDKDGNIYFCPVFPPEKVIMISIEPEKGKRRWVLEGISGAGAGCPVILMDPKTGEDIIYVGTYDRAVALKTDGTIIWDVSTGLPKIDTEKLSGKYHNFGMNYHTQTDSLIAALGDGHVYVLDRKTGKSLLKKPFMMPGGKTPVTNFSLPKSIAKKANKDIAHMVGNMGKNFDAVSSVLHIAAGELQKVTNFLSIDSNSGRIWIAATLPDEEDGKKDGWADFAALYGLDMECHNGTCQLVIKVVSKVPGGTASTPAISADGMRVYVADAFDSIYAIDARNGKRIWSLNVVNKVAGSLNISADNGEIFVNTRTNIKKVYDRGDYAELAWTAKLNMYVPGLFQKNIKALGAEIGANYIAFTGAAGVIAGKQKFPLKLGAGIIDKKTGEVVYFTEGAEDSVSSMVTGPDGGIYIGNSPLRRALGRAILGKSNSPKPIVGGITKFKPIHRNLIIRDALWAAANRARNASMFADSYAKVAKHDIFQIKQLLDQCNRIAPSALKEGSIDNKKWGKVKKIITNVYATISSNKNSLKRCADILVQAVDLVER